MNNYLKELSTLYEKVINEIYDASQFKDVNGKLTPRTDNLDIDEGDDDDDWVVNNALSNIYFQIIADVILDKKLPFRIEILHGSGTKAFIPANKTITRQVVNMLVNCIIGGGTFNFIGKNMGLAKKWKATIVDNIKQFLKDNGFQSGESPPDY